MAAKQLGIEVVPAIDLSHLTPEQKRALIITDNQLALESGWDEDILKNEIEYLQQFDFNLDLLGFDEKEITALLSSSNKEKIGLTDPDEIPDAPKMPVTKPGDIWILGSHRIICGSSTDAETVKKLLNGATPHLMVTDPPYGVEYDANWRNNALNPDGSKDGKGAVGKVLNDHIADWRDAWALFGGDVAYIWHASTKTAEVLDSLTACKFDARSLIIWAKSQLVISRGHYHPQHEPCWYVVRKGKTAHWKGGRKQTCLWKDIEQHIRPDENLLINKPDAETIYALSGDETTLWNIPKPLKSETGHSTQKPVECMLRPIRNNSTPGDSIYEPFSGSGTTLIAAEKSGRNCYAIELNPPYVDIAVIRWQNFTGQKAYLESTGDPFPT